MTGRVQIIGGGMTGLTLALRLARRGWQVRVHEAEPSLGGLSSSNELGGIPVERFYHCILPTDARLLALLEEVGVADEVSWTRTRTGFYVDAQLREMTTSMDFLRFDAITMLDRARLAWTILYSGMFSDGKRFDHEPVGTFLRRHGGDRLFRRIWEPLLRGKLGEDYDRFPASFIWATIHRLLSARKAKGRAEKLGFVRGRYDKVFVALRRAIEAEGGEVSAPSLVSDLRAEEGLWSVCANDQWSEPTATVLCTPAPMAAAWLARAGVEAAAGLATIDYLGVICEALLLREPLGPWYVLNPATPGLPFTGVIETTNLTGRGEFGGHTLVYLPRYRGRNHADHAREDADLHADNFEALQQIYPALHSRDVIGWQINRARHVQPVHPVGRPHNPPVELGPGLAYLSTVHMHPWPVFNDEVVGMVDRELDSVEAALDPGRRASD